MKDKKHGGKRNGAGRPAIGRKETVVVRIDVSLLQAVNNLKNGVTSNQAVTSNQDKELTRLQGAVEELEIERAAIKKQLKAGADDRKALQELQKERNELFAQVQEQERVAALDASILNDMRAERDKLLHGNEQQPANIYSSKNSYDGNSKDFWNELAKILSKDRTRISSERKRACKAMGIQAKKNGQLSSDAERLKVYQWIKDNN